MIIMYYDADHNKDIKILTNQQLIPVTQINQSCVYTVLDSLSRKRKSQDSSGIEPTHSHIQCDAQSTN